MKKLITTITLLMSALMLTACGDTTAVDNIISQQDQAASQAADTSASSDSTPAAADLESAFGLNQTIDSEYDIDLTQLSSSMVYAQVYDMVNSSDNYVGQTVKAKGTFSYYQDPANGNEYFAVLINDAAACCSQGIEFVLDKDAVYPDDYPPIGTEITITGDFNYYKENYSTYCQLLNAEYTVEQ